MLGLSLTLLACAIPEQASKACIPLEFAQMHDAQNWAGNCFPLQVHDVSLTTGFPEVPLGLADPVITLGPGGHLN